MPFYAPSAIDWSGYNTFGQGLAQGIGSFADLAGLSGKAQSLAQLRATLNGQPTPETPFQKLGDLLKGAVSGKGLDGRGVAQQTLGSLTAPQTPATVPAGPGASLSQSDMDTLTQRYGGGTAPIAPVTSAPLPPAGDASSRLRPPAAPYGGNPLYDPSSAEPAASMGRFGMGRRLPATLDRSTPLVGRTAPQAAAAAPASPAAAYIAANPGAPQPQTTGALPAASPQPQAGGLDLGRASEAIAKVESGGNYQAVGPVTTYKNGTQDRPYGKHQVMGSNVGPWTQQYYGQALTPQEFLANPQAQEAVFNGEFGRLASQYGPEGAAQAWLGGPGSVGKVGRTDVNGTTVGAYGQQFARNYGAGGGGVQLAQAAPMGTANDATGTIPAVSGAPQQNFGANIPTEALVKLLTNQYLPAEDKGIVLSLLQTRMPQQKQYGFQIGPDGTMYRTNATTGEATAVGAGGAKPTTDQQEYATAKAQGFKGTLQDWIVGNKQAGATKIDISNTQEGALAASLGGAAGKMFGAMVEDGNTAKSDLANIDILRQNLAQSPTGLVGGIQSLAQDWGINIGKNADNVQVVKAVLAKLVPAQRAAGSGTTSDRDLTQFQNALPKLTGTPGGNALILDTMQAMAEFKRAQAEIASRLAAGEFVKPNGQPDPAQAFKALRALPDPMAAWKANRAAVLAGQPYQSNSPGAGGPAVGTIDQGYRFKGGNAADPSSWEPVQ